MALSTCAAASLTVAPGSQFLLRAASKHRLLLCQSGHGTSHHSIACHGSPTPSLFILLLLKYAFPRLACFFF